MKTTSSTVVKQSESSQSSSSSSNQSHFSLDCLLSPSVQFILLKGRPGSGKTTLAMELLTMQGRGMYVSTRVSLDLLSRQNVRLNELIKHGKVFDFYSKESATDAEIGFEDNRLASAKEIMQSILSLTSNQKPTTDKEKEQMVVLDSWDALAGMLDTIERKRFEHALLTMADANKVRLVFVSETDAITDADYMVDAIVELEDDALENRRTRRIVWKKIRGQEIPQRTSLYSLHNGLFAIFDTVTKVPLDYAAGKFQSLPHSKFLYSTGSKDMDTLLLQGGLSHGSIIVLELDTQVRILHQWPFGMSVAMNFIANAGCSMFIAPSEVPPRVARRALERHLPAHMVNDSLKIVCDSRFVGEDSSLVPLDSASFQKSAENIMEAVSSLKSVADKGMNRPCFHYVSYDVLENFFGSHMRDETSQQLIRMVKQYGDVALLVVRKGSEMARRITDSSDLHLKLTLIDGSPVIYAVKPPSPHFFHFAYDFNLGYPKVRLTPIV